MTSFYNNKLMEKYQKTFAKLILIVLITFTTLTNFTTCLLPRLSYSPSTLPSYKINLDLPVRERYKEIFTAYKFKIKKYALFTKITPLAYVMSNFGYLLVNKQKQDPEWIDYIYAVAEFGEISLSEAIMLSVTYDMACTSVVIQDKNNNIFMGRNLDFGTYFVIAHLMFDAEYYKNDKLLYKGVELIGFRGAINAVKPGKFSVSLNLRWGQYRFQNLLRVYQGYPTPNYNLMKVMIAANTYEEAVHMLKFNEISAPVFYTIAGTQKNEGMIISRQSNGIYRLDKLDVDNGIWFLVVTNTDLDKEESPDDYRRKPAEEKIKNIGRDSIDYQSLFTGVLSQYPNNNLVTAYTSIQAPIAVKTVSQSESVEYFNTTLWLP